MTHGNAAAWIADAAVRAGLPADRVAITFTPEDAAAEVGGPAGTRHRGAGEGERGGADGAGGRAPPGRRQGPGGLLVRQDRAWRSIRIVQPDRPTWLEIDLSAIGRQRPGPSPNGPATPQVMVVLKADAYGHGAVQVAHTALRNGAARLGVACVPEARALRRAGIRAPVLVLGYTPGWQGREAVGLDCTLAVFDVQTARELGRAARALDSTVSVHVKVDTGMHRLGVGPRRGAGVRQGAGGRSTGSRWPGSSPTSPAPTTRCPAGVATTDAQLAVFREVLDRLDGPTGPFRAWSTRPTAPGSCAGTTPASTWSGPGSPCTDSRRDPRYRCAGLRPALAWKSQVAQVHDLPAGASVGYGHRWTAARPQPGGHRAGGLRRRPPAGAGHLAPRAGARPPGPAGRPGVDGPDLDRRHRRAGHRAGTRWC